MKRITISKTYLIEDDQDEGQMIKWLLDAPSQFQHETVAINVKKDDEKEGSACG